jgi:hypothetical protein
MSDPNQYRYERLRGPVSIKLNGMPVVSKFHARVAASPRAFFC